MFDIQLFGTNDTVTSSADLKLELLFTDQDTNTISIPNPKNDLAKADILAFESDCKTYQTFVGDKNGAAFDKVKSATIVNKVVTKLDLT